LSANRLVRLFLVGSSAAGRGQNFWPLGHYGLEDLTSLLATPMSVNGESRAGTGSPGQWFCPGRVGSRVKVIYLQTRYRDPVSERTTEWYSRWWLMPFACRDVNKGWSEDVQGVHKYHKVITTA